ncbi:MAG: serine/threonine protein kinase [Proteobacteria bacterium]|nr:serine/threonine protein kinase [Pseudomonadota bacterium]
MIGIGGFGQVYRGRLEGPEGFFKDVAIKLLKGNEIPDDTLERFRDEARILGLIRDRAIVSVDPPTQFAGRWAVVMEFVDGASAARLLKLGPFPPTVALEIIEEVARALDKIYRHPGVDGEPLHLLHRDLKPGNIQITPSGEVKILDFGIARADFDAREAKTTMSIGGTMGYIAPERLEAVEGPSGDIYSLGVVLHKFVTRKLPKKRRPWEPGVEQPETDDPLEMVLHLTDRMRCYEYEERPTARDLMKECRDLRRKMDGPSLREWAEGTVPEVSVLEDDDLVGSFLTETLSSVPIGPTEDEVEASQRVLAAAQAQMREQHGVAEPPKAAPENNDKKMALIGGFLAFLVVIGGGGIAYTMMSGPDATPVAAAPAPVPETKPAPEPAPEPDAVVAADPVEGEPDPEAEPAAEPVVEAEPVTEAEPEPATAPAPAPAPQAIAVAEPKPAPRVAPQPAPAPAPVAPAPAPAVKTYDLTFSSVPMGAEIFVDGKSIGHTPLSKVAIAGGSHQVRMVAGDQSVDETIQVGRRSAIRYMWRASTGAWEAGY